jgi:hypothetical protein
MPAAARTEEMVMSYIARKTALYAIVGALLCTVAGFESANALNPQPLPPMKRAPATVTVVHGTQSSNPHRLNPQPLPPG